MRRLRAAAGISVAACLLLTACAQADEPSAPASREPLPVTLSPATPAPSLVPPSSEPPTLVPDSIAPPPPGSTKTPRAATVTVSGTVEAGVEPNCLLLKGYLLVGGRDDGLRAGARVTVTGRTMPGVATTCQQGTPLQVETVRPG